MMPAYHQIRWESRDFSHERLQHPEIIKDIPAEDTENDISEESIESSPDANDFFLEWWINFSGLGMLLSSCICLICVSYARHQYNYRAE